MQIGDVEQYFRVSVYVPYLDSLINSLQCRFSKENSAHFNISSLHPKHMRTISRGNYREMMSTVTQMYHIDNFEFEALSWYDYWDKSTDECNDEFATLLARTEFYPAVREALLILLTLPATTCTVERSFSTLRRVKTWLRSTMSDERLSGLCMLSVHREKINKNKQIFIEKVIEKFGSETRRLQFLFK